MMPSRTLTAAVALVCVSTTGRAQPAAPSTTSFTLAEALDRAAQANPAIDAARRREAVAREVVGVARERPNPELHVELTRETPTEAYTVAWPLEIGGKRRRRIAVGEAGVAVSGAETVRAAFDLRVQVRRAYFAFAAARARLALLQELQDLAERAREAAQVRFDAGDVAHLEVLQAALARDDAANQTATARGVAEAAAARLKAWLALPPDADVTPTTPIDAGIETTAATRLGLAPVVHADLAVLDAQLDEQRARVALARALRVPDPTPEAALSRGAEPEFATGWRVGLAVTLPLVSRHGAGVRLETATLTALEAERTAVAFRIRGDVEAAAAGVAALGQEYLRYRSSLVPQALDIERLADDAYRFGRTGIAAYLQALQASRDVRLRMLDAAAAFQSGLADLERALGTPVP